MVSLGFSAVLYPPHLLYKEMWMKQSALCRFSSKTTITTAPKLWATSSSTRDLSFSVNGMYWSNLSAPSKPPCQIVCYSDVGSCTCITGYWVGPDTDDGWGFVEAFIYQTS